ncbi:caveolin-3-like isoform X1 [Strongylocentrotus purpuratus]|uniref:Caveolin n=1 Tax=Strongylocentrotus purpuratus TaxID=7668 RepID=A0A7M7GJ11_STRPU|nr:caveolin-3 isoform X1 [Strongylocentrotus purpuratus]XP_030852749.1 caveolin-3-like isoform X1 [Strongylocentrotus purpuratus]|eukprot:XP_003727004.1 PREDICTED: caveolin-3 isoform X2 [Strongylocentrotus purpuratus]
MTADLRSSTCMPTGPYREPDKMEIYMNFSKNGNHQPLMNEHNQNSDTNGGPKFHQANMVKDVEDLNLDNRDPINMTSHVRIGFEEVFAEPDHQQSFDAVWTTSFIVYTQSKIWCYRLLSAALAIPLALLWGVQLALLTFCHIWWVVPCSRVWIFILNWVGSLWATCIRALCNPIAESCSILLGNVKVQMQHSPQHV